MTPRSLFARAQLGAARATQRAAEALRRAATATDAREGVSAVLEAASHGLGACARLAAYHAIAAVTGERLTVTSPPPPGSVDIGTRCDVARGPCACGAWHTGDGWSAHTPESLVHTVRRRLDEEARRDPRVAQGLAALGIETDAQRERARLAERDREAMARADRAALVHWAVSRPGTATLFSLCCGVPTDRLTRDPDDVTCPACQRSHAVRRATARKERPS